MISDQIFQTKITSDQTEPRPLSRLYCAYDQTQSQTIVQTINRLWSDFPDQGDRFSDQTQTYRFNCFVYVFIWCKFDFVILFIIEIKFAGFKTQRKRIWAQLLKMGKGRKI